jgi:hypothetical protein
MYHLSLTGAIVAVTLVIAVYVYAHHASTAALYATGVAAHNNGTVQLGLSPDFTAEGSAEKLNSDLIVSFIHEGVAWTRRGHNETFLWTVALLVLCAVVLAMHHFGRF